MSQQSTPIQLTRDCDATTVPYGERVTLAAGGEVHIVQQLGSSITVRTEMGTLLRIDGADADALGIELAEVEVMVHSATFQMDRVLNALHGIYDPEIPVNIVDLGLVYRCDEVELPDGGRKIEIDMTMTAPGCGMGDVLSADTERAVGAIPGVDEVEVTLVWSPPWDMSRMSDETKLELGLL